METNGMQRAFVTGPTEPPICPKTFAQFIDEQAATYGQRPSIVSPWQGISLSYHELAERSKHVARALLGMGLAHGDCVGIMAGSSCQHIELLMGGARIGCAVVSLHTTYTPEELKRTVRRTCKLSVKI